MLGGIGEELRKARERMKVSLQKVEEETNMRWRYLEALENEEWDKIPGEAYVKGFLRNYATYLGLDPEEMLLRYKTIRFQNIKIGENEIKKSSAEVSEKGKIGFKKMLSGIIGLMILVFGIYLFLSPDTETVKENKAKQVIEKKPEPIPQNPIQSNPQESVDKTETPLPPVNIEVKKVLVELVIVKDTSWLQIESEKGVLWQGTAKQGQKFTFESKNFIKLWVGNAAAVYLKVNGNELGIMGKTGQVVKTTFEPQ